MKRKLIKVWSKYKILILFSVLVVIVIFDKAGLPVDSFLLAITAIVIYWYTDETAKMRKEITKQNILHIRPVVTIEKQQKGHFFLKNAGNGPAINIRPIGFKYLSENTEAYKDAFLKNEISFLEPDEKKEGRIFFRSDYQDQEVAFCDLPKEYNMIFF